MTINPDYITPLAPGIKATEQVLGADLNPVKYRYVMADIRTGRMKAVLPMTGVTYSVGFYTGQEMSGTVYLPEMRLTQMPHTPLNVYEQWPHFDDGMPLGSMFGVGNTALYVMRNEKVVWGGILWSRSYSSSDKTMAITGLSWEAYAYYRALRKSVVFLNATDKYTIWRALLMQVFHPSQGDFGWTGEGGLNSGNVSAEGTYLTPWTGFKDPQNRPPVDYVERWPYNAPLIEIPPANLTSGLTPVIIDESWRGYDMDNVGTQLEQFANTNNLINKQGFEFRVLCWWDGTNEKFHQRYSFGDMIYSGAADTRDWSQNPVGIRSPLFGQKKADAGKTVFDYPGHIKDWSLSESMENAATRIITTGAGDQANKIVAYASDAAMLRPGGVGNGSDGWLLYDKVFNWDTSKYSDLQQRADDLIALHHVPVAAQISDASSANSSQRSSQRSTELSVSLYVDPTTTFPEWGLGDWVTFSINDQLYGGTMYLQRRIIKYSVTVLPDHESDFSHEDISLELTDDTKVGV